MKRTPLVLAALLILSVSALAAPQPEAKDLTQQFRESGLAVEGLVVYEIGGIVLIRGHAHDRAAAAEATLVAESLGYTRVANLIRITEHDDEEIERLAERQLTIHRSLDGCRLRWDPLESTCRHASLSIL